MHIYVERVCLSKTNKSNQSLNTNLVIKEKELEAICCHLILCLMRISNLCVLTFEIELQYTYKLILIYKYTAHPLIIRK